jgi:hypothetical protein
MVRFVLLFTVNKIAKIILQFLDDFSNELVS